MAPRKQGFRHVALGLLYSHLADRSIETGEGFFLDIILGIVGAVVGGWLFMLVGGHGVTGFNLYSIFVAVVGAIVVLVV